MITRYSVYRELIVNELLLIFLFCVMDGGGENHNYSTLIYFCTTTKPTFFCFLLQVSLFQIRNDFWILESTGSAIPSFGREM